MTTTLEAKREGQARSRLRLTDEQLEAFMVLIRDQPVGARFSANTLREELDRAEIPAASRGGLFNKAAKAGLIEPLVMTDGEIRQTVRNPSTGRSAHHAPVNVYERTAAQ